MAYSAIRQLTVARVHNRTKGTLVASRVEIADSFCARLVGLLGRRSLAPGGGLLLVPCNSVHTVGMRFPIDIVLLGEDATIVGLRKSVAPCSIVWPNRSARSVLELPSETISASRSEKGDVLQIEVID